MRQKFKIRVCPMVVIQVQGQNANAKIIEDNRAEEKET